jgi:hypothetical protein
MRTPLSESRITGEQRWDSPIADFFILSSINRDDLRLLRTGKTRMDQTHRNPRNCDVMPAPTGRKQGGRFQAGRSGNPAGRARGSRNRTTVAIEALLDGEAAALTKKAIEKALEGDVPALRLCFDRIAPPRRDRHILITLEPIVSATDALSASSKILADCANGMLTPAEANELAELVRRHAALIEVADLEKRITALERAGR